MAEIPQNYLDNVKHVLFGNQKQANVINESVVLIVARHIVDIAGSVEALADEASVVVDIEGIVTKIIDGEMNLDGKSKIFIMLTAGEQSLANIVDGLNTEGVRPQLYSGRPNENSPKYNFRVLVEKDPAAVDHSADTTGFVESHSITEPTGDTTEDKHISFEDRKKNMQPQEAADWLQANIIKLAPSAFDGEFVDEKSKALYYSNAYFSTMGLN